MNSDTFSTYNPAINFLFYICAIVFGMIFIHPAFLLCSCVLAMAYYVTVKGFRAFRLIAAMIPLFVIIAAINPIFNKYGEHVLFTYIGGRHYTLEALLYGMALAGMFITVIMWFASYNVVMTSDKFIYLFGKTAPAISLVLTMVLRLVPTITKKAKQFISARISVGKAGQGETKRERLEDGMTIISALTSWALEGGIVTADSMRSRGYGTSPRSRFSIYRFDSRDVCLTIFLAVMAAAIVFCGIKGGMAATYTPIMNISDFGNIYCKTGITAYFAFLAVPTVLNLAEELTWYILRSRI